MFKVVSPTNRLSRLCLKQLRPKPSFQFRTITSKESGTPKAKGAEKRGPIVFDSVGYIPVSIGGRLSDSQPFGVAFETWSPQQIQEYFELKNEYLAKEAANKKD